MEIKENLVNSNKYYLKCPHSMTPKYITIHNTANTASAASEINYMINNNNATGFHIAVDDVDAIIGIPLNRNSWHAGDGGKGKGNLESIGIEICYSKDYATDRHAKAFINAIDVTKQLMQRFNIPIENVVQHNHWSGKDCPHRIRAEGTWSAFLDGLKDKEVKGDMASLINGYQVLTWQGETIHIYKGGNVLELISAKGDESYKALQTIDNLTLNDKSIDCIVNAGYFEMANKAIYGQHYGVEQSDINDFAPKQKEWLVTYQNAITKKIHHMTSDNYWMGKNEVLWAVSPAAVLLHDGVPYEYFSSACGKGKITTKNTQTLLLQFSDMSIALAVVSGKLDLYQCRQFAMAYGAIHMSAYDSGGSSQMVIDGVKKVFTGRKIANGLAFVKSQNEPNTMPNDTNNSINAKGSITVVKIGLNVRKELKFLKGLASGEKIGFIKMGQTVDIIDMVDGLQPDGYQWAKVLYNCQVGYCQYDSQCYWIKFNK